MTAPGPQQPADPGQDFWPGETGLPLDCREKLRMLRENHEELTQVMRDCFEDAVLMGVDAEAMRALLHGMVEALRDPRAARSQDA